MSKYRVGSLEFLEEAKRLGLTGYQYTQKLIMDGKVVDPIKVNRKHIDNFLKNGRFKNLKEYKDYCARNRGFEDWNDLRKQWRWDVGAHSPMQDNEDSTEYLGICIAERALSEIFEDVKRMPYGNPWFDFVCRNGYKIDVKSCCLSKKENRWLFHIEYNSVADYFIMLAIDSRDDLNPVHIWLVRKDEIIRGREFYKRETMSITNTLDHILEFKRYEQTEKLCELLERCGKLK